MPYKCCIPKCKSNYDSSNKKYSVFQFPTNEDLKRQWLEVIPRKNYHPSKSAKVCELHFKESDIERETSLYHITTGEKITTYLRNPRLKKNAVPSRFSGHTVKKTNKESPEEIQSNDILKQNGASLNILHNIKKEDEKSELDSLDHLMNQMEGFQVSPFWNILKKEKHLVFAHFDFEDVPTIVSCIVIDKELILKAYFQNVPLVKCGNVEIPKKVINLEEISHVLEFVENF